MALPEKRCGIPRPHGAHPFLWNGRQRYELRCPGVEAPQADMKPHGSFYVEKDGRQVEMCAQTGREARECPADGGAAVVPPSPEWKMSADDIQTLKDALPYRKGDPWCMGAAYGARKVIETAVAIGIVAPVKGTDEARSREPDASGLPSRYDVACVMSRRAGIDVAYPAPYFFRQADDYLEVARALAHEGQARSVGAPSGATSQTPAASVSGMPTDDEIEAEAVRLFGTPPNPQRDYGGRVSFINGARWMRGQAGTVAIPDLSAIEALRADPNAVLAPKVREKIGDLCHRYLTCRCCRGTKDSSEFIPLADAIIALLTAKPGEGEQNDE